MWLKREQATSHMLQGSDGREVGGAVSGRGWAPGMARQWDETGLKVLGGEVSVVVRWWVRVL